MKYTNRVPRNAALILLAVAGALLWGCGMRDPHFAILPKTQKLFSSGFLNKKVDILWVIDNTSTMLNKQVQLEASIANFMQEFGTKEMDYQIGVTTTDVLTTPATAGCLVNAGGQPKIVTPTNPGGADAAAAAAAAATAVGANARVLAGDLSNVGDASERPREAIKAALSKTGTGACNEGFLRSDAFLAIVIFSDGEDDVAPNPGGSPTTPSGLISYLDTVKTPFSLSGGGVSHGFNISAIAAISTDFDADALPIDPNCIGAEEGTSHVGLANSTYGAYGSICSADFSDTLLELGTLILEATTAIQLAYVPNVASISVLQNGVSVGQSNTNGWSYDAATNRIIFHGTAIPTGAGVAITIDYTPNDIAR